MLSQNNLKTDVIRKRYSRFRTWLLCSYGIWSRRMKQKQMCFFRQNNNNHKCFKTSLLSFSIDVLPVSVMRLFWSSWPWKFQLVFSILLVSILYIFFIFHTSPIFSIRLIVGGTSTHIKYLFKWNGFAFGSYPNL